MDNMTLPILVCLIVGVSVGFLIAKAMEKSRGKKLLNGTRKEVATILKEAKIDGAMVKSLGENIKNLNATASSMDGSAGATNRYNEEMAKATAQMESINNLYKSQLESATRQAEINAESIENATKLKEQMESLASNLSSLNGVYGGMLSAMNKKS